MRILRKWQYGMPDPRVDETFNAWLLHRQHRQGQFLIVNKEKCPFKVGEIVVYQPGSRGEGLVIMTELAALKPGNKYRIARIDNDVYLVLEGFENAAGEVLY